MTPEQAKAYVAELQQKVEQGWHERVLGCEFMQRLVAGTLPIEAFKYFYQYGTAPYAIEINTLFAMAYQRFLPFFVQHPDLMAAVGDKIADEFIHPEPPGHALILFETGRALGIEPEDIIRKPLKPKMRGLIDFARTVMYEGTAAEWFARSLSEKMVGVWAGVCYEALTKHYGFTPQQAVYFSKHEEADLAEHDDGVMAHGAFNAAVLERLLVTGEGWERSTYGLEYCAVTVPELWELQFDQSLKAVEGSKVAAA